MRSKIAENRADYDEILCLYGDCGTGGELDRVLREEGVTRIAGAHCYEFFAGETDFAAMMEEEPGTFFLTDFLARHFDTLVDRGAWASTASRNCATIISATIAGSSISPSSTIPP